MFQFKILKELELNAKILEIVKYDKKEMYKQFDIWLKEINIEYRTTTVNFANYPYTIFVASKIMEMNSVQQNKVALYLFNNINIKTKSF